MAEIVSEWHCKYCYLINPNIIYIIQISQDSDPVEVDKSQPVSSPPSTVDQMFNKFYCDLCKVGAPSQTQMDMHLNGKSHKVRVAIWLFPYLLSVLCHVLTWYICAGKDEEEYGRSPEWRLDFDKQKDKTKGGNILGRQQK